MSLVRRLSPLFAVLGLAALAAFSGGAMEGARRGLDACAAVLIPSLFPFFIVSALLRSSGAVHALARSASGAMPRAFGVPGCCAAALALGLAGGYPIGAATLAALVRSGDLQAEDASNALAFCNCSGPAFLIGAAGAGIFASPAAGALLYASHIASALLAGLILRARRGGVRPSAPVAPPEPQPGAFTEAVAGAVRSMLTVCGYVVAFSALTGALEAAGVFSRLAGGLAVRTGLGLKLSRALLTGFFELGGGLSALSGAGLTPLSLACASLLAAWGGLSVHFQTAAVFAGTGVSLRRHTAGKLLAALLSAAITLLSARFIL